MKSLFLAFLAGLVGACGFEPLGLWPLTLAAFAALLWLIGQASSLRSALARGWWFGVGNFVLGLNWIATAFTYQSAMPVWLGWIAVVLLSLYLAVYPAMAAGLAWRWGRGPNRHPGLDPGSTLSPSGKEGIWMPDQVRHDEEGRSSGIPFILIFAAAWIVTEWLRATMFTGFAWNPVGVSLLPTPASWLSTWIGTYGLSGIAILLSGSLFLLFRREWRHAGILLSLLVAATALAALTRAPTLPAPQVALRIVQPNIGQENRWTPGTEDETLQRLARLSRTRNPGPRLLLWPESAITPPLQDGRAGFYPQARSERLRRFVGSLLRPDDVLLAGGITFRSADGENITSGTNSVFAMDRSGRIFARYDKAHLVPYGEYLPMRSILEPLGLSRLAPGDVDFDSGPGAETLSVPLAGKIGFQICYEIIFSGAVVDRRNRPGFLYNPSNDAWFGSWGPPQHLAQARLRALEEGLPVLRSTPTGISAVVDAEGRLLRSLPWRTAGVIDAPLPAPKAPTLFARAGNILPFIFALLLVGIAVAVGRKAR